MFRPHGILHLRWPYRKGAQRKSFQSTPLIPLGIILHRFADVCDQADKFNLYLSIGQGLRYDPAAVWLALTDMIAPKSAKAMWKAKECRCRG